MSSFIETVPHVQLLEGRGSTPSRAPTASYSILQSTANILPLRLFFFFFCIGSPKCSKKTQLQFKWMNTFFLTFQKRITDFSLKGHNVTCHSEILSNFFFSPKVKYYNLFLLLQKLAGEGMGGEGIRLKTSVKIK